MIQRQWASKGFNEFPVTVDPLIFECLNTLLGFKATTKCADLFADLLIRTSEESLGVRCARLERLQ